jgi:hypothetical protein
MRYLSKQETETLINSDKVSLKYKVIILLMLDAGLRVSEVITLQLKDFDFRKRILNVNSLKKRGKEKFRHIPISNRLFNYLADYIDKHIPKSYTPTTYLFESYADNGHISRKAVWKYLHILNIKLNIPDLHPHALRHTFATHHLAADTKLEEVKKMLGHSSYDTTLIYTTIPTDTLAERINRVSTASRRFDFIYRLFEKKERRINIHFNNNNIILGRNSEILEVQKHIAALRNTLVIGSVGVGKSMICDNIKPSQKIIKLDDSSNFKKSLANILLWLYKGDKEHIISKLYDGFTSIEIVNRINRESGTYLVDTIKSTVEPKEYILHIDDIDHITPSAKKYLEKLKDTFIILACSRSVKASDTSFLWNFEIVKITNLSRADSMNLINSLSSTFDIENREVFREHIYQQSVGNPRAILELIDKYKSEPILTLDKIRDIKHIGALPDVDYSFIVLIGFAILISLRFIGRETHDKSFQLIGAMAMILLVFIRPLFKYIRKNTI